MAMRAGRSTAHGLHQHSLHSQPPDVWSRQRDGTGRDRRPDNVVVRQSRTVAKLREEVAAWSVLGQFSRRACQPPSRAGYAACRVADAFAVASRSDRLVVPAERGAGALPCRSVTPGSRSARARPPPAARWRASRSWRCIRRLRSGQKAIQRSRSVGISRLAADRMSGNMSRMWQRGTSPRTRNWLKSKPAGGPYPARRSRDDRCRWRSR